MSRRRKPKKHRRSSPKRRVRHLKVGVRKVRRGRYYRYVRGGKFVSGRGRGHRGGHYANRRSANRYQRRPLPYKK